MSTSVEEKKHRWNTAGVKSFRLNRSVCDSELGTIWGGVGSKSRHRLNTPGVKSFRLNRSVCDSELRGVSHVWEWQEVLVHKVNLDGTDQPWVAAVEGIPVTTSPECTNVVATQDSYSPDS
ncbi:hypothetical protein LR48_Vigan05g042400 [Vigna angularis]|uniref:Uncharacterized protein n=1 Tax=Phaseolus angularis TaxID=3914 RepID=A0A0L9UIT9_PHAAN|nr:hypothetical protein LR48_Vigan05g042400 [Vigna angularis]